MIEIDKTKIIVAVILIFLGVLIALAFAGYLVREEIAKEKEGWVTDPVIAHIPLRADLDFPDEPILNRTVDIIYTLTPQVDVKTDVSEGLILPEGIVFVENNLPTGQITLSKGRTYRYSAKIKVVKPGRWTIYASPGVYADLGVFEDLWAGVAIYKVMDATIPLTRYHLKENLSKEHLDILKSVAKESLREYSAQREHEKEEFNCSEISGSPDISYYGCEMICYSNSKLHDRYYFVIEEDRHTKEITVRNVYRWAYWTPSGFESKPVCEEITRTKI